MGSTWNRRGAMVVAIFEMRIVGSSFSLWSCYSAWIILWHGWCSPELALCLVLTTPRLRGTGSSRGSNRGRVGECRERNCSPQRAAGKDHDNQWLPKMRRDGYHTKSDAGVKMLIWCAGANLQRLIALRSGAREIDVSLLECQCNAMQRRSRRARCLART